MLIPRGKYLGKRFGGEPADESEHFSSARLAAPGSICATSAWHWSMKPRCRIQQRTSRSERHRCVLRELKEDIERRELGRISCLTP
jgi:hypothetical protein